MTAADGNGVKVRLEELDRRLSRLEAFEPAAMSLKLDNCMVDVREVRSQLRWQTRALVGAMLTMLSTLAVVLLLVPHG